MNRGLSCCFWAIAANFAVVNLLSRVRSAHLTTSLSPGKLKYIGKILYFPTFIEVFNSLKNSQDLGTGSCPVPEHLYFTQLKTDVISRRKVS